MPLTETLAVTQEVVRIFEQLGAPCIVGGSVASSLHGIPRATQDVDIVVQIAQTQVSRLLVRLADRFYVDEGAVRDAIRRGSSFNIIHLDTMYKVDVFVCTDDPLALEEFARAGEVIIDLETGATLRIADAADIILQKLIWYEIGNRVSERQWRDIIGVIKVSGEDLDMEHLCSWAVKKNLWQLLQKAFLEAGCPLISSASSGCRENDKK